MYLKTLTIRGFKSFASKTTFDFEPGVTSVIGPNGSGKSNVVDALSWVMGEQGVKNLRGGKMEDVIFAGTTGRSALGRAQVDLTIDNSDGTLPIDFSEVTISRTLFRSGGSEYQINGESARLLDIQELLSDSGLGREMHVIVGQGQLDRILQATPEERRGFIEEAAGILKHRRRKERSERKLESMRANLDRIRDLTEEVHRQLGPLSKQASTARKAQQIQHDVRDSSARLLADDVVTQTKQLQELVDSDDGLEKRQQEVSKKLEHAEQSAHQLSEKHTQTAQASASARDHRHQLTALAERYRSLQALAQERYKTASRAPVASSGLTPEEAERQLGENTAEHEKSQKHIEVLATTLEEAQEQKSTAERQARIAQETHTHIVREEADQQKSFAVAESRKSAAESKLDSLKAELQRLIEDGSHGDESTLQAEHEVAEQEAALTRAESELSQAREEKEETQQAVQKARQELRDFDDSVSSLKGDLSAARARLEVLEQSLQPDPGSAHAAIREYLPRDVSEILNIDQGWETAIASLLAGSTDRLWLNSLENSLNAASALDQQDVSDVRIFYPGSAGHDLAEGSVPSATIATTVVSPREKGSSAFEHIKHVLASSILVENFEEARRVAENTELLAKYPHLRIATRQGHVLTAQWLDVRGAGAVSSLEQRAAYDRALEDSQRLSRALEEVELKHADAVAAYESAQKEVQQTDQRLQQAQSQVTTLRERVAAHRRSLEQQSASRKRNEEQQTRLRAEIDKARQVLETAIERFDAAQAAATYADESTQGVENAAAAQQQAEQEASRARAAETDARLALRTAENTAQQAEQRVEQSRRRLSAATIAQQEYQRALIRQRTTVSRLSALLSGIEAALDRIEASVRRADSDYQDLEEQNAALRSQLEAAEKVTNDSRKELAQLQEQLHKRRLARQEQELKLEQLHERSLTELGYSHQYLVTNFGPDQPVDVGESSTETVLYDRKEQEKRLRSAKRNLSALGKINPLALEEYAAVQERHEYLTQQLQDLEESRRDLLRIIEDVDATVLQVFSAAYADTAAQFEHVFATLFPGGEGRLSLTEPDNMLHTGIEVEARPAGKKVKRLSLLSGGEKSLAAIALLVSIFKARPSPFYVMDEVEAALDDTNLTRLLTILKELQNDSQLIIITHQKRTMEISDALYGVSMRGDGVSQVISQRLDQS
ncbi:MAG: chromosome segregation protein SMC [Micrococcaceae bacterium]|nr:chromosome segregation protein SMC [Micrococcaceae bacterium]